MFEHPDSKKKKETDFTIPLDVHGMINGPPNW